MAPLSVAIVDDSTLLRMVVRDALAGDDRLEVVVEHADAASALRAVASAPPDVLVLDNSMPGIDGVDALPELRALCPHTRIVMFSSDDTVAPLALDRGADAFVGKEQPLDDLRRAVLQLP